jgi:2-keto-4-pentenoate hydratase/2-oxohepta-3-ene-1,7-dioic acid hydratase in catechol pathway
MTRTTETLLIARYRIDGRDHHGRVVDEGFVRWGAAPWEGGRETGPLDRREIARLLPASAPTKIVCVGLNYRAHVAESATLVTGSPPPAEPLLFLKPPSALIGSGEAIRRPPGVERVDPEGEVAVVIGRRARRVTADHALEHVAGVTAFNDVSARDYQRRDGQWARAKGFDTFAPLGPWVAAGLDPGRLAIETRVNGAVRQRGNTSELIFPVPILLAHISSIMTLEPGDVIATGTPAGVANIAVGDRVEIEVEGVGVLVNSVAAGA